MKCVSNYYYWKRFERDTDTNIYVYIVQNDKRFSGMKDPCGHISDAPD